MPLPDISQIPPVDEERIVELKEQAAHDASLFNRLFALFEEEGPTLVASIDDSLKQSDRDEANESIHKVKGSSAAMGAKRVYALASAGVEICRGNESLGELSELPELLTLEYAAYCEAAKKHLA